MLNRFGFLKVYVKYREIGLINKKIISCLSVVGSKRPHYAIVRLSLLRIIYLLKLQVMCVARMFHVIKMQNIALEPKQINMICHGFSSITISRIISSIISRRHLILSLINLGDTSGIVGK